jgi:PEP-CTERM motif
MPMRHAARFQALCSAPMSPRTVALRPAMLFGWFLAAQIAVLSGSSARAQTVAPGFAGSYTIVDLGAVPGLAAPYGGLTLKAGDLNTLLIGGSANNAGGVIDSIGLTRDGLGHISGFSGTTSLFATAPNIDGGLSYGPNGVLFFTEYPNNSMGEIKPGSSAPDKTVLLTTPGIVSSVGSLGVVPSYAPGAGSFKIASYSGGGFYDAVLTADGSGTFDVTSATLQSTTGRGPEGFIYVPPGSPVFGVTPSLLMSEYSTGTVSAYTVDSGGNPIPGSRQDFITGLTGAEGAFLDPGTGDFLFSTFGGSNHVFEVQGFTPFASAPEPSSLVLVCVGLVGVAGYSARSARRKAA